MKIKKQNVNPWSYIPTLYFAEGVPYILINTVSVMVYKRLGVDNADIAFWTSWLYLPWVIKMFWGPLVDNNSTKRNWIFYTQLITAVCLGIAAFSFNMEYFFPISLMAFVLGAFVSATHDIAADGFYLLALNKEQQAYFVGIRSVFYRIAMIFGSGLLVYVAGHLEKTTNNIPLSWTISFGIAAVIFLGLFVYHKFILPYPEQDYPRGVENKSNYGHLFKLYFSQKGIVAIIGFILFYRFGEAMLVKLAAPFLLDPKSVGGLGLATEDVGIIYGTVGVLSLILGGVIGGIVISKFGLKKMLWPMAIVLNIPHAAYLYMAMAHPPIYLAYPLVAIEQFGYGFGFTAFMVYLMYISRGEYKTTFYAISTGIMALGMMLPGFVAGYVQKSVGYVNFFIVVLLFAIPGLLTLFFIPLDEDAEEAGKK